MKEGCQLKLRFRESRFHLGWGSPAKKKESRGSQKGKNQSDTFENLLWGLRIGEGWEVTRMQEKYTGGGYFWKNLECHTKESTFYLQRREKVKKLKQEGFSLNSHYRNITLGENGWMQVRLKTSKPFKRLFCTCSIWKTMSVFN